MKRLLVFAIIALFCTAKAGIAFAADETKPKTAPAPIKMPAMPPKMPARSMPPAAIRGNINMLFGTITNIDAKDPAKVKLEVMSESDGKTHTIEVIPTTTITKVTDISEIKKGENARIMVKKVDDKDVAMGIMFGKVRKLTVPKAAVGTPQQSAAPKAAPAAARQPKK